MLVMGVLGGVAARAMLAARLARAAALLIKRQRASDACAPGKTADLALVWAQGVPMQRPAEADFSEQRAAAPARRTALEGWKMPRNRCNFSLVDLGLEGHRDGFGWLQLASGVSSADHRQDGAEIDGQQLARQAYAIGISCRRRAKTVD